MSGLFGPTNRPSMPVFDFSALGDYYVARAQLRAGSSSTATARTANAAAQVSFAPWAQKGDQTTALAQLRDALTAPRFIDANDSAFNRLGVEQDHKKLF